MIKPGEIQNKAREFGVRDQQIEKDYILSWVLQGIAQHEELSKAIVFKGGTVLKKVYFEDYRFSEDLDFTLLDDSLTNDQIFEWFEEVFEYIKEEANIPLEIIDNNEHEDGGINFYISYTGPLGGLGANKKVKVDISRSENLVFEPVTNDVFIRYSDQEEHQLLCYSLEEVLVEKLRSVMQRMQARDFYDIWYLLEEHGMDVDFFINEFKTKCENKDVNPADFHNKLEQRLPQYKGRWQKSMADQIHDLPDFDTVLREVLRHLKKLEL
ncbi:MAG: nucleotidyl transferase AbiEii/AbiGii toxin family protein [Mongoliibacter sp.]|uniref:nucleotidyl transferase AbiEii/AbiGii toxin family protein n=1 Tax=Mongoliibacter sp. TaxID=2022438 RepID=UPI0012EFCF63|nr:nucleotidyl transferase AbiEii/AbiGii toxin family protein [Mongoliibacter sp.]TVP54032.1 MAG: nucleotidyl transferase AbiEii/AbiGii toxin family protein [Mongoliibacter sp.]